MDTGREILMNKSEKQLYAFFGLMLIATSIIAIYNNGLGNCLNGFLRLQWHSARLISDFTVIEGEGAALLNAVFMGTACLCLIKINSIKLSGPSIAAFMTVFGFSLFGKTPLNSFPIVLGVFLAARLAGKSFANYLLIALFGTALGPWTSFIIAESGISGVSGLFAAICAGILTGFLLPSVAIWMLRLHEGYNLYNIGLTSGFLGIFGASFLVAAKHDISMKIVWNYNPSLLFSLIVPLTSLLLIFAGLAIDGRKSFTGFLHLQKHSGRLPSDFITMTSSGAGLMNMGLLGLCGCILVLSAGSSFSGPVVGALLTVMGFGVFGKNFRNCWPVVTGVCLAAFLTGHSLAAPGPVLALLFGTTLAPLAGEFGFLTGITAGMVHFCLVMRTAQWHGGLSLYNNGLAGGLTATLIVAFIEWYKSFHTRYKPEINPLKAEMKN